MADTTRRAIGKKDIKLLNEQLPKILEGYCNHSSQPREIAEQEVKQFIQIIDDSSEYQFGYNHSTGYSKIGCRCMMLRAYYPLEFTAAYFNRANDAKHRLNGMDLLKVFNFQLYPIQFGKSQAEYTPDKATNSIYKGIASIKYCNKQIADELYELSSLYINKPYNLENFLSLLQDIKTKTSVDARQLEILTTLNFFNMYGENKYLLDLIELYNNLADRKQFNAKQIQELNINTAILEKYCAKQTAKLFKELDMLGYIKEVAKDIPNKQLGAKQQIKFEHETLGYIDYVNSDASEDYYIVIEFKVYKDKTKPYIVLRQIKTGMEFKTKVTYSSKFVRNPFEMYSILKVEEVNGFREVNKRKNINGEWVVTNEKEKILNEWGVY